MSTNLTVAPLSAGRATNAQQATPAQTASATPAPAANAPIYPNPAMHIDPSLNILVIEFHNAIGALTASTPTQRQLDAYRLSMSAGGAITAATSAAPQMTSTSAFPLSATPALPPSQAATDVSATASTSQAIAPLAGQADLRLGAALSSPDVAHDEGLPAG